MSLTVPRAPNRLGATAAPIRPAPQGAGAIAGLGDTMLGVGTALENDRLDRQMQRAAVDLERDMGQLRLEVAAIGDPDAMEARWREGAEKIRQGFLSGQDEYGRPRIDPKNSEKFGLAFDGLYSRHEMAIGTEGLVLRQSARRATYFDYSRTLANSAAAAGPAERPDIYGDFDRATDAQVAAGAMTPEQAASEKARFRAETENAELVGLLADDPAELVARIEEGGFENTAPDTLAGYRARASAAIASAADKAARDAEAARKTRETEIGQRLGEVTDILRGGRVPVDLAWLNQSDVQAHPKYPEAKAAYDLAQEKTGLATATPAELRSLIAEEKGVPLSRKYQAERLKALEDLLADGETAIARNRIEFAADRGLTVPALAPDAEPRALAGALLSRAAFGAWMDGAGYSKGGALLSGEDAAALRKAAAADADPAERARIATAFGMAAREAGRQGIPMADLAGEIGASPEFTHTAQLIAGGGAPRLAQEIFSGQQSIEQKTVILPPLADRTEAVFDQIAGIFADVPGGAAIQSRTIAAADALYAARRRTVGPSGEIDTTAYAQALHEVLGGTGEAGTPTAAGGIQEVLGRLTPLPAGVRVSDAERAIAALRTDASPLSTGRGNPLRRPKIRSPEDLAAILRSAAGAGAGAPEIDGQPITADDLDALSLRAVGDDRFVFVYPSARGDTVVTDDRGAEFTFSLTRLIRGVDQ